MKKIIAWFFHFFKNKTIPKSDKHLFTLTKSKIDARDHYVVAIPTPVSYDDSQNFTVRNQGNVGDCGSFASVNCLEEQNILKSYKWPMQLSELFHYWNVRQPAYGNNFPADTGQCGRDAMRVLYNIGVCPEKLWPYVEANVNKKPDLFCDSFARFWKIFEYAQCETIGQIKTAKSQDRSVWLGIPVQESILSNKGEVIKWNYGVVPIGGHGMAVVGYDDNKRVIKCVNQWGADWGENGFCYIDYDYINQCQWSNGEKGIDCWAFVA